MIAATSFAGTSLSNRTSSNQRQVRDLAERRVVHAREQRPEAGVVLRLRRGQADRAIAPAVERAEEGDDVRPLRREPGELDRRLDDLGAGVAEVGPGPAAGDRRDLGDPLARLGVDRQVEVARAEVEEVAGLLLDRPDDRRVGMAGRVHRDAGGEVEEEVAVDVLDRQAVAADGDDRVGARQARRRPGLVVGHVGAGLRAGQLRDEIGHGPIPGETVGHGHSGHLWLTPASRDAYGVCRLDIRAGGYQSARAARLPDPLDATGGDRAPRAVRSARAGRRSGRAAVGSWPWRSDRWRSRPSPSRSSSTASTSRTRRRSTSSRWSPPRSCPGTWGAVISAFAAFLLYNFLFVEPTLTLTVAQPGELVNLVLLLFVGIVVGQLVALQRPAPRRRSPGSARPAPCSRSAVRSRPGPRRRPSCRRSPRSCANRPA